MTYVQSIQTNKTEITTLLILKLLFRNTTALFSLTYQILNLLKKRLICFKVYYFSVKIGSNIMYFFCMFNTEKWLHVVKNLFVTINIMTDIPWDQKHI